MCIFVYLCVWWGSLVITADSCQGLLDQSHVNKPLVLCHMQNDTTKKSHVKAASLLPDPRLNLWWDRVNVVAAADIGSARSRRDDGEKMISPWGVPDAKLLFVQCKKIGTAVGLALTIKDGSKRLPLFFFCTWVDENTSLSLLTALSVGCVFARPAGIMPACIMDPLTNYTE